jgi:hypothetical protein
MNLRRRPSEARQPAYVVRAPNPNNRGHWLTLAYAWPRKNGGEEFSLKLNSIPMGNWDGALLLLPPFADEMEEAQDTTDWSTRRTRDGSAFSNHSSRS